MNLLHKLLKKIGRPLHSVSASAAALLLLMVAAYIGNYFSLPFFFGLDFLFGSIAVWIVMSLYGVFWGIITAFIASTYTYILWGHPYAIAIFTCEALFVGLLLPRKQQNTLLLDVIYWLFIGIPLIWIFYYGIMHLPLIPTLLIVLKQSVNGIFNALFGSLIITYIPIPKLGNQPQTKTTLSLQQTLLNLLIAFVFLPALLLTALNGRYAFENIQNQIISDLQISSREISTAVTSWQKQNLLKLREIADLASDMSQDDQNISIFLSKSIENTQKKFPFFQKIYVFNSEGKITYAYPEKDDDRLIDKTISDDIKFQQLKNTQDSILLFPSNKINSIDKSSTVVLGTPIFKNNNFIGGIFGEIQLQAYSHIINEYNKEDLYITIVDAKNKVIASTYSSTEILKLINSEWGKKIRQIDAITAQWLPIAPGTPIIGRWQQSFYIHRVPIGEIPQWNLIVGIPIKKQVQSLQNIYINNLAIVLLIAVVALIVAVVTSYKLVEPTLKLAQVTTDLPEKLLSQAKVSWPESKVTEIHSLTRNFQTMVVALNQMFQEIKTAKETLEHRVEERTEELSRINQELESEIIHRQKVEAILREREERYDLAISGTNDGIWDWNLLTNEVYYSPTWMRILGYEDEPLPHVVSSWLERVHPDDLESARAAINQHLAGDTERYEYTCRLHHKNGHYIWILAKGRCICDDQGKPYRFVGTIADMTEEKLAEEQLKAAKEEAETANSTKSQFLATMSHEIRTPMNAVIGMTGLLLDTELTPQQREFVEIVRNSGENLLTLINEILDFSKVESGKLEIEKQPFHLRTCIEESLDLLAPKATEKSIELAYLMHPSTPEIVVGDMTRLRQILVNLLSNAVKFTPAGEAIVSVTARTRAQQNVQTPICEIEFAVRDTGIGIPKDKQDRLFKPFSQVDASTTRQYGGTGLGLAICHRLTELMGGKMWLESDTGKGSTFSFTILAEAIAHSPLMDNPIYQHFLANKRLLVVDDNVTNRTLISLQAQSFGAIVQAVGSGTEALTYLQQGDRFDTVILDMQMPSMDGLTLAAEIRKLPNSQHLPLILLTSIGQIERERQLLDLNFAGFLTKPIKRSQLGNVLISALSKQVVPANSSGLTSSPFDTKLAERLPLRILLAEDNIVNQKVALSILKKLGYRADVAANGLEVLTALQRQTYDVILMDVQMPEMDGLTATRHICQEWSASARPWIIAMTANAMQGDKEACLEAGMNDYVSKPIQIEALKQALSKCQPKSHL
ncbi:hypothetical protein NUACC21_64540 [Scytonema sp. NUACC21]